MGICPFIHLEDKPAWCEEGHVLRDRYGDKSEENFCEAWISPRWISNLCQMGECDIVIRLSDGTKFSETACAIDGFCKYEGCSRIRNIKPLSDKQKEVLLELSRQGKQA